MLINEKNTLSVFPNPALNEIAIQAEANTECTITDITGKIYLQSKIKTGENKLDIHALQEGIYFMTSEGNTQKLIVDRK